MNSRVSELRDMKIDYMIWIMTKNIKNHTPTSFFAVRPQEVDAHNTKSHDLDKTVPNNDEDLNIKDIDSSVILGKDILSVDLQILFLVDEKTRRCYSGQQVMYVVQIQSVLSTKSIT